MNRPSNRGVALVITLIMLSVITFLAIAFLAISRRNQASVKTSITQTEARAMAEAANSRAVAEAAAHLMAKNSMLNFDLLVSQNYVRTLGFTNQPLGTVDTNNVNYDYLDSGTRTTPLSPAQAVQNIANLYFNPRPPVFVKTNLQPGSTSPLDFRFYMDLNRNGRFDTNGYLPVYDDLGLPIVVGGKVLSANFTGDPEWIGVLKNPRYPHSPTNQFVGRYLYFVVPVGQTLDVNYIHNAAKRLGAAGSMATDSFSRNQGVGPWELNLAAFLQDLNTNAWTGYDYKPALNLSSGTSGNFGDPFYDALSFLNFRYRGNYNTLQSANGVFGPTSALSLKTDFIDIYSDGPLQGTSGYLTTDNDDPTRPWPGSPGTNSFYHLQQDLFDTTRVSSNFLATLRNVSSSNSSYNRYTFYRMLAQLGTDSAPETNRLNLNYKNVNGFNASQLVSWTNSLEFFTNVADRMIKASLTVSNGVTLFNGFAVQTNFGLNSIQVFPVTNNQYSSAVHRLLQVAANLYEATTNGNLVPGLATNLPNVYRPIFAKVNGTNVFIVGYTNESSSAFSGQPWRDLENPADLAAFQPLTDNVYGVPVVIGARKGYPNFNEYSLAAAVQITRKLQFVKTDGTKPPTQTNQMYMVGVSNLFGAEVWNSYSRTLDRLVEIRVTNSISLTLTNPAGVVASANFVVSSNAPIAPFTWTGYSNGVAGANNVRLPLLTNIVFLPNSKFISPGSMTRNTNIFDLNQGFPIPNLTLVVTNRLLYVLVDKLTDRVLDLVSLSGVGTTMNFDDRLNPTFVFQGAPNSIRNIWNTNRVNNAPPSAINTATIGVQNQIDISLGNGGATDADWRNYSSNVKDKNQGEAAFKAYMSGQNTNLVMLSPFEPTITLRLIKSWQVNDPLVHYTLADLTDPRLTNGVDYVRPPENVGNIYAKSFYYNLGKVNTQRYLPWPKDPLSSPSPEIQGNFVFKDPGIHSSDDWNFPTNKFPSLGWIGRVHRGTPWQTIYLKSERVDPAEVARDHLNWLQNWSGTMTTYPTNDWSLLDLFTVAPYDNATRGLLSVNQTNLAAWSAALSGITVVSNSLATPQPGDVPVFTTLKIEPAALAPALRNIVTNIYALRTNQPAQAFNSVGAILAATNLTVTSPFLDTSTDAQAYYGLTDEAYERIPMELLSLLKVGTPRYVIYAYGQSLRPAPNSIYTSSGPNFGLCTNYQIMSEVATRSVVRIDSATGNPRSANAVRAVVESYNVLAPE